MPYRKMYEDITIVVHFSKLKVAPPNQDYRPDVTSPVLIKTLLKNGFPHPRLKLKKLDSCTYKTHACTALCTLYFPYCLGIHVIL